MKWLVVLWQDLPKRHKLVLGVLLILLILLVVFGLLASRGQHGAEQTTSLALPPLPQTQVAQTTSATANQQPTTYEGNDLRIAARRPVLTSPGLEFITSAPPVVVHAPQTTVTSQPASSTNTQQGRVGSSVVTPAEQPSAQRPSFNAVPDMTKPTQSIPPQKEVRANPGFAKFAALPADAWLLQIAAVSNEQDAQTRCHSLSLPCTTYATTRQGRPVWVLVAGPYASRADALAAVARLPVSMQRGPFPRQAKEVRHDAGD